MKQVKVFLVFFLYGAITFAQTPVFTASTHGHQLTIKTDFETEFDYCFDGVIKFYHPYRGSVLQESSFTGDRLASYTGDIHKLSPNGDMVKFNISLHDCSDEKVRTITSAGYQTVESTRDPAFRRLTFHNSITLELDALAKEIRADRKKTIADLEQKEQQAKAQEQENINRTIKVGETYTLCNYGKQCSAISREVAGDKVKVEFIQQCYASEPPRISSVFYINAGEQRWIDKKNLHLGDLPCYKMKSGIR